MKKLFAILSLAAVVGCAISKKTPSVPEGKVAITRDHESNTNSVNEPAPSASPVQAQPKRSDEETLQFKKNALNKVMEGDNSANGSVNDSAKAIAAAESEGWKLIDQDDGVTTYRKNLENGDVAFRGEVMIPASILKIAGVFDDPTIRKDWIDALVDAKVLRQTDRLHRVEYNHTAVPWPFQDRDFVYDVAIELKRNPSAMTFRMKSVEDDLAPVKSGVVRGKLEYCYYYITEVKPNELTRVIVEVALDPMGAVPKWLVNLSQKKWPHNTLDGMRRLAQKPEIVIPIDLEEYFKNGKTKSAKSK